ncbi:ring-cleaving dioxygenase [Bacillus mycoides]|uniref:ring-cleaving dioxygenase n=1 Tax=Bacillus mycoides TaxID=1405 RepID=UPI0001A04927|nr:ring-cleaving dioxygenase [Bacillus mycoides]EEL06629.1 Glyoxalase [Bacillus cereus BDRD-ST196]AIW85694.1 glyoxalase/Bleomycin resistance /Dioxygenase superfamily protein [Bacillus mycoides]QWH60518.1 ring-cleaving dioxygenase [Bacillus mycoides]GAE38899.1 putative ring-cleaving dioxygenase [Bacillus mycoides NBRC 101238 = DSM 11821]HDR7594492.1 ring-cleaving dioxygenase [Bacillus mycoides]
MYTIPGHHHISMVTKNAKTNNNFYRDVLGLRRVKKTVNQDNPFMYHLFYGDLTGSAGTELSFFEMPNVGRTIRGTNAITQIGLLVPSIESLTFWKRRFESLQVAHGEITTYAGRDALHIEDPDGLRLVLLNNKDEEVPEYWTAWDESSVEQNHRILGMGTVEMTVRSLNKLSKTLTGLFSYKEVSRSEDEGIYQSIDGQSFGEILVKQQDGESERPGKGSIHHLAIRVKNDEELSYWNEAVKDKGFQSTGIIDRFYFKSLYFRESNGILFEIATDGPGFTVDSTVEELGKELDLPPFLEERRKEIEEKLIPLY